MNLVDFTLIIDEELTVPWEGPWGSEECYPEDVNPLKGLRDSATIQLNGVRTKGGWHRTGARETARSWSIDSLNPKTTTQVSRAYHNDNSAHKKFYLSALRRLCTSTYCDTGRKKIRSAWVELPALWTARSSRCLSGGNLHSTREVEIKSCCIVKFYKIQLADIRRK